MGFLSKAKNYVGLDIGSSTVKVVELKPAGKGGTILQGIAVEPLAPEVIVDGSIMDSSAVIDAIQRAYEQAGATNSDLATSLSGHAVIIKKITLPRMSNAELDESINWEAEQYIPFDIEDVNLDYSVLEGESISGAEYMDVLLVAVKKEKINDYTGVVTQAGKNPLRVDIDTFALQHVYEQNYTPENDKIIALINIGASVMNINIIQEGVSSFWRDISMGGNQFTDAIQKDLGIGFEQAEELKKGEGDPGQVERTAPVIQSVSQDVAAEIQKTLDFYRVTSSRDHVDKILLSGGGSKIRGLDTFLADTFNCEVEFLNPFSKIQIPPGKFSQEQISDVAPIVALAVGLALTRTG